MSVCSNLAQNSQRWFNSGIDAAQKHWTQLTPTVSRGILCKGGGTGADTRKQTPGHTCRTNFTSHSPALRLWVELLVKCHRETKKGAPVSQLVKCVSRVQVEAQDLTEESEHSPQEESPKMRRGRWEGESVSMSHQGCHSGVQVLQQSKFSSTRAQGRFLLGPLERMKEKNAANPVWVSLPLLSSVDVPCFSWCCLSASVCCCQSAEQAVKMWLLLHVCFSQCMCCASPSSMGDKRTSALNSPLTPTPPLSLSLFQALHPHSLPPLTQLTSTLRGLEPKCQARLSGYLGGYWTEGRRARRLFYLLSSHGASSCCRCLVQLRDMKGNNWVTVLKVKKSANKRNERLCFHNKSCHIVAGIIITDL